MMTAPAQAQEPTPDSAITGEMTIEIQNDWATRADDSDSEGNDLFLKAETGIAARLAPGLSANSLLVFEPVRDRGPGDRFFGDEGLYVEELFLEYTRDGLAVRGGKFAQKFGIGWDAAPGIWGRDFAEDYELSEQIGIAVDYTLDVGIAGRHTLTLGTFFADTTVLSESAFTNRGRARRSDGGAGNTEDFSSYAVTLEGEAIPALSGLGYHLAYVSRGTDAPGETRETGIAATLIHTFKLGEVEVRPLVEWVRFEDRDGMPGTDATYLTTSVVVSWNQWNLALSRTGRETESVGGPDVDDSLAQISAGYAFDNGINVNIGYRATEDDGIETGTYGFLVDYAFEF